MSLRRCVAQLHKRHVVPLSAATEARIAGLHEADHGFNQCLPCSGNLGSFKTKPWRMHLMLGTTVTATEWQPIASKSLPELVTLQEICKTGDGDVRCTAFEMTPDIASRMRMLCFHATNDADRLGISAASTACFPARWRQVLNPSAVGTSCAAGGITATASISAVAPADVQPALDMNDGTIADASEERFVFVCAHRQRDSRCGYCGAVLVDLLRRVFAERHPSVAVHVFPCSHIGGHVYAGNVLCYSKYGGHCFGCVTPDQVTQLVDYVALHGDRHVPESLRSHLRGSMSQ